MGFLLRIIFSGLWFKFFFIFILSYLFFLIYLSGFRAFRFFHYIFLFLKIDVSRASYAQCEKTWKSVKHF
jgi:hypothetical protein